MTFTKSPSTFPHLSTSLFATFCISLVMLRSLQRCTASIACSRHTTITSTTTRPRTRPMATVPSGEDRLSPHIERKRGTIEIICGPMFSGKTTELLRRLRRQQLAGRRVILIKHAIDNRYGARLTYIDEQGNIQDDAGASTSNPNVSMNNQTSSSSSSPSQSSSSSSSTSGGKRLPVSEAVTHDNIRFRAVPAQTISSVASLPEVRDADVIGVDEGQFFEDLAVAADKLANTGKRVVVAALDGTFRQEVSACTVRVCVYDLFVSLSQLPITFFIIANIPTSSLLSFLSSLLCYINSLVYNDYPLIAVPVYCCAYLTS